MSANHRTQFDHELLVESKAPMVCRNHGRQILVLGDGSVFTALAWAGDAPVLRVWKGREPVAEHFLNGRPSPPCLVSDGKGGVTLWISVDDKVCSSPSLTKAPMPISGCDGVFQDVGVGTDGRGFLAVQRGTGLYLVSTNPKSRKVFHVDNQAGHASYVEDPKEANPQHRFKGLLAHGPPWGNMAPVTSPDAIQWFTVKDRITPIMSDGCFAWDSGRIALAEPPFQVGGVWRQYYTGCGWKHGLFGEGKAPHRTSNNVGLYSPNQVGIAEIEVGHWAHLQLSRETNTGTLVTIPLRLATSHALAMDVENLDEPESTVRCAILDAKNGTPLPPFDFSLCDPIRRSGDSVTWQGSGLEKIGSSTIRIAVCLMGYRVKLFGLNLGACPWKAP